MPFTRKKAYLLDFKTIEDTPKDVLKAFCFLPESTGLQQKILRASLREHKISLYFMKLNIIKKFIKFKNLKGINNRIGLLLIKDYSDSIKLKNILLEKNIILNFLWIKNIIIFPCFLEKKKSNLINLTSLITRNVFLIKQLLLRIIIINNKIYADK